VLAHQGEFSSRPNTAGLCELTQCLGWYMTRAGDCWGSLIRERRMDAAGPCGLLDQTSAVWGRVASGCLGKQVSGQVPHWVGERVCQKSE
jgi:hypothetical protein